MRKELFSLLASFIMIAASISVIAPFMFSGVQASSVITVDGNPNDWTGALPPKPNTMWISNGELVVRDVIGDERTDLNEYNPDPRVDITQFRMTEDSQYYYFMVEFKDMSSFKIGEDGATFLLISIGDGTNTGEYWLAGSSDTKAVFSIKYQIVVNLADSEYSSSTPTTLKDVSPESNWGGIFYIVNSTWKFQSPAGAIMSVNLTCNTIEIRIPRDLFSGNELNITVASARGWSDYATNSGGTKDVGGSSVSNLLDTVNATGVLNANTWSDVKDQKVEHYIEVVVTGTPQVIEVKNVNRTAAHLYWWYKNETQSGIPIEVPVFSPSYLVEVSTDSSFNNIVKEFTTSDNYTTVEGLTPGTTYWVRVSADGGKTWSPAAKFTTAAAPSPPSGLRVYDVTDTQVWLKWNPSSDATKYEVEIVNKAGEVIKGPYNVTTTEMTVAGLSPNTKYVAKVRTIASDGTTSVWINDTFYTLLSFPNISSQKVNSWRQYTLSSNEQVLCWKDAVGDVINTTGGPAQDAYGDMLGVCVAYRNGYLYVLFKMRNLAILENGGTGVGILIDVDHKTGSGNNYFLGFLGSAKGYPTAKTPSQAYWEYAIKVSLVSTMGASYGQPFVGSEKGNWNYPLVIVSSSGGGPIASPNSYFVVSNASKEIEVAINCTDLGLSQKDFLRMMFYSGRVNQEGNFWWPNYQGTDVPWPMDVVSNLPTPQEMSDGVLNYYSDITVGNSPPYARNVTVSRVSAEFNWTMVTYSGKFYWQLSEDDNFSKIVSEGNTTDYNVTIGGLSPSTTYYFRVSADGGKTWSNVVRITTLAAPAPPKVSIVLIGRVNATFKWNQVESGAVYDIKVIENSTGKVVFQEISYSKTEIEITGLSPDTQYTFEIRTHAADGTYSSWRLVQFKTLPPPSKPSGLKGTDVGKNFISVSWSKVSGPWIRYDVRICLKDDPNDWIQEQNGILSTYATFYGLSPGREYYIFVRANGTDGTYSGWSSIGIATTVFRIDGNGSDWDLKIPQENDTWTYEHGILIWKDALNDERTDYNSNGHVPPDLDLEYFAVYSDGHYAYFLVKLKGLTKIGSYQSNRDWKSRYQGLGLIIGISNGSSSGMTWLPNYINAKYPFPVQRQLLIMLSNPGWDYNCKRIHGNYAEFTIYALKGGNWIDVASELSIFVANASTGEIEIVVPLSDLGFSSLNGTKIFVATGVYDWHSARFLTFGGTGVMDAITFVPGNTWNEISQKIDGNFALHSYLVYNGGVETIQAWKAIMGTQTALIGTVYAKDSKGVFLEGEFLGTYYGIYVPCNPSNYGIGDELEVKGVIQRDQYGNLEILPSSIHKIGKKETTYPEISVDYLLNGAKYTEEAASISDAYLEYFKYYSGNGTNFLILNSSGKAFVARYYGGNLDLKPGFVLSVYGVARKGSEGISLVLSSYKILQLPRPKVSLTQRSSGILITWSKIPYASYYIVEVSKELSFKHILYRANLTSTTWFIGGIPNGTYYARVKAFTSEGISSPWGVSFALPPPEIISIEVSSNSVEITWKSNPLVDYYVYEVSTCKSFSKVYVSGKTEYNYTIISNLRPYTKYYFRIEAVNSTYGAVSPWTIVSFKTSKPYLNSPIVYGKAINQTAIRVWWNPVPYADHYQVAWSTNNTLPPGPYITVKGTSVNITGLNPATTYYIFVRAVSYKYNESSEWASINVETEKPTHIETPELRIVRVGVDWVLVELSKVSGADHYVVEVSSSPSFSNAFKEVSTSNLINVTGLAPYTKYYVRGYVVNETYGIRSNYTQELSFVTLKPTLTPPKISLVEVGSTFVKAKISPVKYANCYEVELYNKGGEVYQGIVQGTLINIHGLYPNVTYVLKVRALNTVYQVKSSWTTLQFTTKKLLIASPQIRSIQVGSTWIKLSWYPVEGADRYRVEVSLYQDLYPAVFVEMTNSTSVNVTGLMPETEYYVGIAAYNTTYKVFSTLLVLKVITAKAITLKAPANLTVSQITTQSAIISWSNVNGALYYIVQLSTSLNFSSPRTFGTRVNSLELNDLSPNTTYYVRVKAEFLEGSSSWSYVLEFTTLKPIKTSTIQVYYYVNGGTVRLYLGGSNLFYIQIRNVHGSVLYTVPSSGNLTLYFYSTGNYTLYVYGYNGKTWILKPISFEIKKPYTGPMTIGNGKLHQGITFDVEKLLYRWLKALPKFWLQGSWTKVNSFP